VLPVGTVPVAAGVDPEFPGVVVVVEPDVPELPEDEPVVPVAAGVEPELPGVVPDAAGVEPELPGVVPDAAGIEPELPGVAVDVEPVVPVAAGVEPELPGVETGAGTTTAVALTGVVATVINVTTAAFFAAAGVEPDFPGAAAGALFEFPFEPEELAVHCATHVIAAAVIVTEVPAEMVDPLLQLHPANV
jgi:hypothetical protein